MTMTTARPTTTTSMALAEMMRVVNILLPRLGGVALMMPRDEVWVLTALTARTGCESVEAT